MDELIGDFLAETGEGLQTLDTELVELEQNPEDYDLLSSIFRVMHTIKGTCGFLGLSKLESVAHAGENIMDKIRNKHLQASQDNISVVLEAIDAIKSIVAYIGEHGSEPNTDYSALIAKVNAAANSATSVTKVEEVKTEAALAMQTQPELPAAIDPPIEAFEAKNEESHAEQVDTNQDKKKESKSSNNVTQTIRVSVDVLESLMQIVSELVLNRNQLIQLDRTYRDGRFAAPVQRLNLITSSLQETVMETRMQPISNAWIKFPRMVRDLSQDLKKKVQLVMIGEETELDRQLIESIKDPLTHMIRNSVDHGLENPAERIAAGKNDTGTVTLKAYHQGGHIIIEISDDGRGMNIKRIKKKIAQNNLATEAEIDAMTDQQAMQYIFRAGFSTAEVVTAVSGRGVGMDVVRSNIENIRGTVEMKSIEGKGSTFIIKIPLTLAIMPILVVESKNQKFGVPQINVIEMVRAGGSSEYNIEEINNHKVLRLRDSLLPLIILSDILKLNDVNLPISATNDPKEEELSEIKREASFIVVCEVSGNNFGLIVDKIYDTEEIVLKPVSRLIKSLGIYSGNTLLGNGDVIMILDPSGIVKFLTALNTHTNMEASSNSEHDKKSNEVISSFLILKAGAVSKAIPLELVSRLEEIDVNQIELAGNRNVVQYRGSLMYLTNLDLNYQIPKAGEQQVVVFINKDHILGLVVEEIVDIVEQNVDTNNSLEESNLSALVIGGKTMDVIDINDYFSQIFSSHHQHDLFHFHDHEQQSILYVDDSPFFRKFLPPSIEQEGYEVVCIENAIEAVALLEKQPHRFNLIITDINMPYMDGYKFANFCTKDEKLKHIPIIALTSNNDLASEKGKIEASGLCACITKTSYDELLKVIHTILKANGGHEHA